MDVLLLSPYDISVQWSTHIKVYQCIHFESDIDDYSMNRVFHFETERQTLYYARRHLPGSKRIKT